MIGSIEDSRSKLLIVIAEYEDGDISHHDFLHKVWETFSHDVSDLAVLRKFNSAIIQNIRKMVREEEL